MLSIINPTTNEVIAEKETSTQENIKKSYSDLQVEQKSWKKLSISSRAKSIEKFKKYLLDNIETLATTLTQEMGKPLQESQGEIRGACERIQFFLDYVNKWPQKEVVHEESGLKEVICYEPLGVVGNISAWNYPYLVGVNVIIPALISGNSVLYKPSEYTTLTGLQIEEGLIKSGVPENVFKTIIGKGDVGKNLLELPLDGCFFTGSVATGKSIYQSLAPHLIPCGLELGGKDPLYVMEDFSDIQKAASIAASGVFYNNGQSCCAVERIYVHQKHYQAFIQAFKEEAQKLRLGNPQDPQTTNGPLTRKEQMEYLQKQVEDAINKGAKVLFKYDELPNTGQFFPPTVLTHTNHSMMIMKEESFGPIVGIQEVKDDQKALELMADTDYGLTASFITNNHHRALKLAEELETGSIYINCCDRVSPRLPWAGRKNSGIGQTLSHLGILPFLKPKAYHIKS